MQPTHAEVARTLAAGHLPAGAHIACRQGPFPVRHVTDAQGRLLLLSPRDGALAAALRPLDGNDDTALVLDISDVPPVAGAPVAGPGLGVRLGVAAARRGGPRGRARLRRDRPGHRPARRRRHARCCTGWTWPRSGYERDGALFDVDPDEYAEADAGPAAGDRVRPDRRPRRPPRRRDDRLRAPAARPGRPARRTEPAVVRLDRYGFLVRLGERLARLAFPRAVQDRHDLAHLLHPVLCHRCGTREPGGLEVPGQVALHVRADRPRPAVSGSARGHRLDLEDVADHRQPGHLGGHQRRRATARPRPSHAQLARSPGAAPG